MLFRSWLGLCALTLGALATPVRADDLAICRAESGDVAIAACTRFIDSAKGGGRDLVAAYVNRGLEYSNKGDHARAIADASEGIRIDPTSALAYANRGSFYYEKGDYDHAIADATEAIKRDPTVVMAYSNRAAAYNRKNDFDRAIADATQAIRLDPTRAYGAYANRALSHLAKNNFDRSIEDATEALRINPKLAPAFYTRSTARRKKGDLAGGNADLAKARELQPGIGD